MKDASKLRGEKANVTINNFRSSYRGGDIMKTVSVSDEELQKYC